MGETSRRLVWTPIAQKDLRENYFARVASLDIADGILQEINQSASRLPDRPYLGRAREEVRPGLRGLLTQPYTIFYRVTDATVEVVRVLHERRDFPAVLRKEDG
jgi:toxin ParE1/3/4